MISQRLVVGSALVALVAGLSSTRSASAQVRFEIVPIVGVHVPTTDLVSQQPVTLTACDPFSPCPGMGNQTHLYSRKYTGGLMVGSRFAFLPPGRFGAEGAIIYARSGSAAEWGPHASKRSYWIVNLSTKLVVRLTPHRARTSIRLGLGPSLGGRGGKYYQGYGGLVDLGGVAGAGVAFNWTKILTLRLDLENRIYQPRENVRLQNDLMVSAGLAIHAGNL